MGYIARLIYGSRELDLNDATYSLGPDFAPPGPVEAINIASGTFRNTSGGEVTGTTPQDRELDFSVRILGASSAETHSAGRQLIAFLNLCKDKSEKLYLEYDPSDAVPYRPLWGQSVYRYHIKAVVQASLWDAYFAGSTARSEILVLPLVLLIGPHAEGLKQQSGTATGGITEDSIGANGQSRGLIIPGATGTGGNEITNPYFAHATYDNDWSVSDAALIKSVVTNPNYVLFGKQSCRLVNTDNQARALWMSINTADTSIHAMVAYVKRPNGEAVSATQCQLYYNAYLTTAYTALANGWYRLNATASGINGATFTGLGIAAATTLYVQYIGFEENIIPLVCHGDLLGCAWAGTAQDSASSRTAAFWRFPIDDTNLNRGMGTIRFAWKAPVQNTIYTSNIRFFDASAGGTGFYSRFIAADDTINFIIGAQSAISTAVTFAAESWHILHYVWGPATIKIYLDGVQIASEAPSLMAQFGTYLYLGSSVSPAEHTYGTYNGLTTWANMLSATEIAADYANQSQVLADGKTIMPIPWRWTLDGDNVVDNCDDATHANYCVMGGIPGDEEALTEWRIVPDVASTLTWWLGKNSLPVDEFVKPVNQCYLEGQGTATAGTDSDSNVDTTSVTTVEAPISLQPNGASKPWLIDGDLHYFIRLSSAVSTLTACPAYDTGSVRGTYKTLVTDATRRLYYLGKLYFRRPSVISRVEALFGYEVEGKRTTGTNDVLVDFSMVINGPLLKIVSPSGIATDYIVVEGKKAILYTVANLLNNFCTVSGEEINLDANKLNLIWFIHGADGAAHDIADTATFSTVYVTPRWALV